MIIPNGICLPNRVPKREYKETKIITYIGRLTKWQKGLDLLLEACNQIQETLREKHIVIRCYGPEQGDAALWMKSYCRENHLTDIVQILGPVYDEEKIDVLAKSDLFIMTSRFEGMPMGLLEAMSYGLPCIITPGTNMQHEIVTAGAGFGCEENPSSIAKTILQAAQASTQLVKMSNAAVKVAAQYSWDEIAEQTHVMYEQLLADLKK